MASDTAAYGSPGPEHEITHKCPPERCGVMPCCGKTPFEVPPYHRMTVDPKLVTCGLTQVGWMLSPDLAVRFDVTPLDGDYLLTVEQAERDGGIRPEFADQVIPIYRKADE